MKKLLLALLSVFTVPGIVFAEAPETGIVKANKDFVTVISQGEGANRNAALEQAWTDAVRIAVGMVLSAKSNVNNEELSENIITHSRGVIEDFDILQENKKGSRTQVFIQARVRREILRDEANKYSEAQVVKADTGRAVKAQMDDTAKDTTKSNKTASGVALLKEVFDSYGPEDFFSATLNPKIQYDKETKKPYIQINEKFNQDLFWKDFLPRVRQALEGIALKKEKKFYSKEVRQANQQLPKVGYSVNIAGYNDNNDYNSYKKKPYWLEWDHGIYNSAKIQDGNRELYVLQAIIPNDNASYTVYYLPSYLNTNGLNFYDGVNHEGFQDARQHMSGFKDDDGIFALWFDFVEKMSAFVTFSVTYLDRDGETISVQPLGTGPRCFCVYRSFNLTSDTIIRADNRGRNSFLKTCIYFAPGYVKLVSMTDKYGNNHEINNLLLGTANYNQKYGGGYEVELDSNELQQLDSMKFEIIYN